jgi:two-component system, sporulation sensor kinase E
LNIWINYISSSDDLEQSAEQQMNAISMQVGATVEANQYAKKLLEDSLGEKLRFAAIAAQTQLDPDIDKVTNEQLVALSTKLGVDHITLWRRVEGDIIVQKSSDPKEINLSSKTWEYWFMAFNQLFDNQNVTIPEGQKLPNYWSGPIDYATSDPTQIKKWGNYHDGTTNYMINPFVNAQVYIDYERFLGTEALVNKILKDNPNILEITGFNPQFLGKEPSIDLKHGIPVYNLDFRDIIVGQYRYKDSVNDIIKVQEAIKTGKMTTSSANIQDKHIMKTFVPTLADDAYVIGVSFDRASIQDKLVNQLILQSVISFGLILLTLFSSYWIAGFMMRSLNQILSKVDQMAAGNFGATIAINSKDELGLLASRVNTMASNLHSNMTDLKNTAEELRSTKEYLESFFSNTSDAIHVVDMDGLVIQVNPAFVSIYGWSEQEAIGEAVPDIKEDRRPDFFAVINHVMLGKAVADYETLCVTKDGRILDISMTISPIRNEESEIVAIACISRNITERKQTEEGLRRSEKLSLVGQLAAGVAHEIRNPLTTLRGFVQLQQKKGDNAPFYLDIMLSELDRINFIVSEFLVLAKPQINKFQPVDVSELLQELLLLLDTQASLNNIQIETKLAVAPPLITCEANQLKQVFTNVIKNGMEAMTSGGTLTVEVEVVPSDCLIIRITDQGCGIPQEELKRLGEPFFTTKENGNGLGIMVSQQIIANHKGSMRITSELEIGTCVEIKLPLNASLNRTALPPL